MEDYKLVAGQEFPDVKTLRSTIKESAIAQHFELKIIKSDLTRYIAKCASQDCPWRIRAVKLPNVQTFTIKTLEPLHTCGKTAQNGHHQASVDWIVNFIENRLRVNINYKPKDILHDIYKQYGITIPYKQAWRAKERGLQAIYGSSEEGYCLLPVYFEEIKKSNPGSIAEVLTNGVDNRFHRLFVSFYASIYGFLNGCLPIICIGGVHLKGKYTGTLLSATSFDSQGDLYPLAFSIVDFENDESWTWFLSKLHDLLEMYTEIMPRVTFILNGFHGLYDAVKSEFPGCFYAVCMRYLTESISKEFKNSRLVQLLWDAAYSTTITKFNEKITEIGKVSSEAAKWLEKFPSYHWALIYSESSRFGHLSSNFDEFSSWIVESWELPINQVIERIHSKLSSVFEERKTRSNKWFSTLVPSAEDRVIEAMHRGSVFHVLRSDEVEFEVLTSDRSNIVNIGTHSCSCRDWQLYGLPCEHAMAALISCKKDIYEYTEKYFSLASYREAYSKTIHLITGKIEWEKESDIMVRPPKFRRPPGRPEKKRLCVEDVNREKHTVHCSRCNQTGHYKSTCKVEVMKCVEDL